MSSTTESKTESDSKPEIEDKIQFNERTLQAFESEKLDLPHGIIVEKERNDKFRSKFKQEKGALQKIIETMSRRPLVSYDPQTGKAVKKDVLTYTTEYHGFDWLGNDLWIRDHVDGVYYKPKFRVTTTLDPETGDHIPKKEFDGMTEEYYIELTDKNRKEFIEKIINESNGTIIEAIKFYYHVPQSSKGGMSFRCDQYTYDQFINSSLDEMERLARTTQSPIPYSKKDTKGYMG
jgi:hypothetical protein